MRLYLQAFTKYTCKNCGKECTHHVRPAPSCCKECVSEDAIRHGIIPE